MAASEKPTVGTELIVAAIAEFRAGRLSAPRLMAELAHVIEDLAGKTRQAVIDIALAGSDADEAIERAERLALDLFTTARVVAKVADEAAGS
jgi:hypothetical protein